MDFIYRSLEYLERVISDADRGQYELNYGQQPPFGYFSPTYLDELSSAVPLLNPSGHIGRMQSRVAEYPEALRREIVQNFVWSVKFALHAFARKFARRGEVYLTASTIARCVHALDRVLFALHRRHLLNDKKALPEISAFLLSPDNVRDRVEALLSGVGTSLAELEHSVSRMHDLFKEVARLSGELYSPKYDLSRSGRTRELQRH